MPYTFHHITDPTWRIRRGVRAIYQKTFAPELRHNFRELMAAVRDGSRLLYIGRDTAAHNRIVCFAFLSRLPGTTGLYGEYIGTAPTIQNQGVGKQLFKFLTAHIGEMDGLDTMVIDAEAPKTDAPDELNRRRLRYHERLGLLHIPSMAHYRVPIRKETLPMCLMWMPLGERTVPPDADEIAAWVRGIFGINYYDPALAEQLIDTMGTSD